MRRAAPRVDRRPSLVVSALPFGYGPAAKALAIARRLPPGVRRVFVGEGSALELVARTDGVFDTIVEGRASSPEAAAHLARAYAVLSLMDREAARAATAHGVPLVVVDSLLWMRRDVPDDLRTAASYVAQRFPGLEPERFEPRPQVVGPLVGPTPSHDGRRDGLVVHLGGSAAPDGRRPLYLAYARLVVGALLRAGLTTRFHALTFLGGSAVMDEVRQEVRRAAPGLASRLTTTPRDPDGARQVTAAAAALLTAPGLTSTLEAFTDGTPAWFLPPQNYSQWCILRRLRAAGAAPGALHWEDLPGVGTVQEREEPSVYDAVVPATIDRLVHDDATVDRLARHLADVGERAGEVAAAQASFRGSLGPDGLDDVARLLDPPPFPRPIDRHRGRPA